MSNPWKKPNETPKPPGAGQPAGNLPPWMKNKVEAPQTQTQVPPTINKIQPSQTQAQTQPASTGGGNLPPWMKNKDANPVTTGGKPPGNVTSVPATSGNIPPWMKNKTSPLNTDRKAEEQKQKEEEEAKAQQLKAEEEERAKNLEIEREQKELKRMSYEEELSRAREAAEKIQEEQNNSKRNKKGEKKTIEKSPLRQKQTNKEVSLFHNYIQTLNLACAKQEEYRQKIQNQKEYIENMFKFTQTTKESLKNYLNERKISHRKKNIINLDNLIIEYGLVEGVSGESGSTYFKTRSIEKLEEKFSYYQVLFNLITKLLRKVSIFRIRAPLITKISYKGIEFLCEGVCDELLDSIATPAENYVEIHGEINQLEKELADAGYQNLTRKNFDLKKVSIDGSDFYIIYLSETASSFSLSDVQVENDSSSFQRLTFYPNLPLSFDNIINLNLVASKKISFGYLAMKDFESVKKSTTEKLQNSYLNLFELAHAIRIVYASCQGELEESSFWSLVFNKSNEIWELIKTAYNGLFGEARIKECVLRNKFALSKILELMIPITFGVGKQRQNIDKDEENIEFERIPISLNSEVKAYCYPLESFEYFEITQLFDKNIENYLKINMAEEALSLQEELISMSEETYLKKIDVFTNKIKLLLKKESFDGSDRVHSIIEKMEKYDYSKGKYLEKLIIQPMLITLYMSQSKQLNNKSPHKRTESHEEGRNEMETSKVELVGSKSREFSEESENRNENSIEFMENKVKETGSENMNENFSPTKSIHKFETEDNNETKMLKTLNSLICETSQVFEDNHEIWYHAELYTIMASYYSSFKPNEKEIEQEKEKNEKRQSNFPIDIKKEGNLKYFSNSAAITTPIKKEQKKANNIVSSSRAQSEPPLENEIQDLPKRHPYAKECLKFLEFSHRIYLDYFGLFSPYFAEFLLHAGKICHNIKEYCKSDSYIQEAVKIFKSSSKHTRNTLACSIILAKSKTETGSTEKDIKLFDEGIAALEALAEELQILGLDLEAIEIYEYLWTSIQSFNKFCQSPNKAKTVMETSFENKQNLKIEEYIEKLAEISFNTKNIVSLKKVLKKIFKAELSLLSKERVIAIRDLCDDYFREDVPDEEEDIDKMSRLEEIFIDLEELKGNFGTFVEMAKWSIGIMKFKSENSDIERATDIINKLFGLFPKYEMEQILLL